MLSARKREAEIVAEADDAAVLDAGFGFEFEGGDDGAGVDLRDLAVDFEFRVLRGQNLGDNLQLVFVDGLLLVGTVEEARGWEFVTARDFREGCLRLVLGVSTVTNFDFGGGRGRILRRRHGGGMALFQGHRFLGRRFLGHHALDAVAGNWSRRLHARNFLVDFILVARGGSLGTHRRGPRGHELGGDGRLFGAAFFQFLLLTLARALVLPVFEAVSQRHDEGEAGRRPEFDRGQREGGGEVERDGQNRGADNVGAGNIQVADQRVADDAAGEAFDRNRAHPAKVPGQDGEQRRDKHEQPDSTQSLGNRRLHGSRAEPAHAEHAHEDGQEKRSHSPKLQDKVGKIGSEDADPVAGSMGFGQDGGAVQRGIERRIGREREEKEERGDAQDDSDELVQTPVPGGRKNLREKCHVATTALGK